MYSLCSYPLLNRIMKHIVLTNRTKGLGRSKFLPKPLPHEINVLLSNCDQNCHHDGSEKSTLPPHPTPLTTTHMLTTATPSVTSHIAIPTATAVTVTSIGMNNINNLVDVNSIDGNLETYDDDDDDENRIG